MTFLRNSVLVCCLGVCTAARAVYAPIPEQQQGKDLVVSLESGFSYNTNIFGAASNAISSFVFEVSPKVTFNTSVTDQTFFSAEFQPRVDYFDNRPGSKTLYSQNVDAHLAHAFSKTSVFDLNDAYAYNQNPEALLNGAPVNTNQTLQSNELNGRYSFAPTEQLGVLLKARSLYYDYTDAALGNLLNRLENLYGAEADYALLPEVKAAAEYRHLDVDYRTDPSANNKHSDFLMGGFDYKAGPEVTASVRVGGEYRTYAGLSSTTTPYAQASLKYDYDKGCFVSAGYTYSLEETSDPFHYADEKVNRAFVNIQHAFSALVVGSASVDYEPATLIGRPGVPDAREDSTHAGVAATYLPSREWAITASYDYDLVDSAVQGRGLNRSRIGLNATVTF